MWRVVPLIIFALLVAGCGTQESVISYADLPAQGDVANGERLFNQLDGLAPSCVNCHQEGAQAAPHIVVADYPQLAANRVEGQDAREYTFHAIANPGQHIVEGYGNAMYNRYDENLTPQQIADLVDYLVEQ